MRCQPITWKGGFLQASLVAKDTQRLAPFVISFISDKVEFFSLQLHNYLTISHLESKQTQMCLYAAFLVSRCPSFLLQFHLWSSTWCRTVWREGDQVWGDWWGLSLRLCSPERGHTLSAALQEWLAQSGQQHALTDSCCRNTSFSAKDQVTLSDFCDQSVGTHLSQKNYSG